MTTFPPQPPAGRSPGAEAMVGGLEAEFLASRQALLRFLAARGAGDSAEDLLQELWLKVAATPSGPVASPLPYLYRMANNLMLDRRRGELRARRRDRGWFEADELASSGGEPSPEGALIAREQLRRADAALDALGERTAAIFRRFRLEGASQRDIAAEFGISLSAVEKHLQRAYRALIALKAAGDAE